MLKDINEGLNWLNQFDKFSIKPGLQRMEYMLERLDHPERRLKFVHIAGTNGKGSTSAMMESILREAGHNIGLFTSPYLQSFTERIRFNGESISDDDLLKIMNKIRPIVEELSTKEEVGTPTEFEIVTVIALEYFAKTAYPDLVIWETGLGGRLDSTNVVTPLISVITNIGLDHTNVLGTTLEEIAREKAGIIKNGVSVVTGVQDEESLKVIEEIAKNKKSTLYRLGKEFTVERQQPEPGDKKERFHFYSHFSKLNGLQLSLLGEHQVANASVALMALQVLNIYYALYIEEEHIRAGLLKTTWPGRFEVINEKPTILLDGAHNEEGVNALVQTLKDFYPDKKVNLLFAVLEDKPYDKMIELLVPYCNKVFLTSVAHPRQASPDAVAKCMMEAGLKTEMYTIHDWREAFRQCLSSTNDEEVLLVAGSLYFISDIRNEWLNSHRKVGE
jgi:dihydrofolate synthase/folylpolyglutamate synthase